jgi:hypothetical protein
MSTLSIGTGTFGFISPETNLKGYGMKSGQFTDDVQHFMRLLALGQIVNGATLIAAESGTETNVALTGSALMLLGSVPGFEKLNVPKGPIAVWIVILSAMGKAAREGKMDAGVAANFAAYFQIVTSVQEIISPQLTYDSYKMPKPSPLGQVLFNGFVWNKLANGLFVIVKKKTGCKALGLAAHCATAAFNCFKMVVSGDCDKAGIQKAGPLAWGVVQIAIAVNAYKNGK